MKETEELASELEQSQLELDRKSRDLEALEGTHARQDAQLRSAPPPPVQRDYELDAAPSAEHTLSGMKGDLAASAAAQGAMAAKLEVAEHSLKAAEARADAFSNALEASRGEAEVSIATALTQPSARHLAATCLIGATNRGTHHLLAGAPSAGYGRARGGACGRGSAVG